MKFPILFYFALGVSAALLAFLPRFVSFWPKFRNVAEITSSGMGVLIDRVHEAMNTSLMQRFI